MREALSGVDGSPLAPQHLVVAAIRRALACVGATVVSAAADPDTESDVVLRVKTEGPARAGTEVGVVDYGLVENGKTLSLPEGEPFQVSRGSTTASRQLIRRPGATYRDAAGDGISPRAAAPAEKSDVGHRVKTKGRARAGTAAGPVGDGLVENSKKPSPPEGEPFQVSHGSTTASRQLIRRPGATYKDAVGDGISPRAAAPAKMSDVGLHVKTKGPACAGTAAGPVGDGLVESGKKLRLPEGEPFQVSRGCTTASRQLTRRPGATYKDAVGDGLSSSATSQSKRRGSSRWPTHWTRYPTGSSASDFGGLDFRWGMYPQDRRWHETNDLRYAFVETLDSPPHPVHAGTSCAADLAQCGVASDGTILRAARGLARGVGNALPYRTLYERPTDYVVGMHYDTHYQLPTLSRLLQAKQPEFLQNSAAAARELQQRWHQHGRIRGKRNSLPDPTGTKFQLRLSLPPNASCLPIDIEGNIMITPGGTYRVSAHTANRSASCNTCEPCNVPSRRYNVSSAPDVSQGHRRNGSNFSAAPPVPRAAQTAARQAKISDQEKIHSAGYLHLDNAEPVEVDDLKRQIKERLIHSSDDERIHAFPRGVRDPPVKHEYAGSVEGTITLAWQPPISWERAPRQIQSRKTLW